MNRQRSLSPDSRTIVDGLLDLQIIQRSPRTIALAQGLLNLAEEAFASVDVENDIENVEQPEAPMEVEEDQPCAQTTQPAKKQRKKTKIVAESKT